MLLLSDNPREIIETVFEKLSAHLGLEAYFNYLLTEDGSRMRLANYRGISPETAKEIEWLEFGQAVCGCVAHEKTRIVAEDVQHSMDARTVLIKSPGITAYCCHPWIAHDRLIGTLSFGTRNRPAFTEAEVEVLYVACNQVAAALDRHNLIVQLQKSKDELEQKVAVRTIDLSIANAALTKTNKALRFAIDERARAEAEERKARFEADLYLDLMGHDISNMHQVAMNSLELVMDNAAGMEDDDRSLLENSLWALEKSTKMIDSVRKLHAIQTGEVPGENMDLGAVLSEAVNDFRKLNDNIDVNIPDGTYTVYANRLLPVVFSSLIDNSIKRSKPANVVISIDLSTVEHRGRLFYQVSVEDDGPGIPDARKAKILGRFNSRDANTKGIGTGLYIARSLVESYRGNIYTEDRVKGDYTKGARLVVMLPAVKK
jgi:signal transduction histidine kinase